MVHRRLSYEAKGKITGMWPRECGGQGARSNIRKLSRARW